MKQRFLLPCIAFLALALCCSAVGAQEPESIEVSVGGVHYRLLVPKGYRHVPETAPEYAPFAELARNLPSSQQVLAIFADEQTLRFFADGTGGPKLKCVIACAFGGSEKFTRTTFAAAKKFFAGAAGRETLNREMKQSEKELGLPPGGVSTPALRDSPAEYMTMSAYMPLDEEGNAMGMAVVVTVVDTRLLGFGFYDTTATPDTLDTLVKEAGAHARQYIDAGLVVFAPEAQSLARTESTGNAGVIASKIGNAAVKWGILACLAWIIIRRFRRGLKETRRRADETAPAASSAAPPANDDNPGTTPPGA